MNDIPTSNWGPTKDGLRQYLPSGVWYYKARAGGRVISGSTGLTAKAEAKKFLQKKIAQTLLEAPKQKALAGTIGQVRAMWEERLLLRVRAGGLSEKTRQKRLWVWASILETWPGIEETAPSKVSGQDLLTWQSKFRAAWSADYTNKAVTVWKELFDLALKEKFAFDNPTESLVWSAVDPVHYDLPGDDEVQKILQHIKTNRLSRFREKTFDLVQGILFSGLRIEEARLLRVVHVESIPASGMLRLRMPASICKGRKHGRTVHLSTTASEHFKRLCEGKSPSSFVFDVKQADESLASACEALGLRKITHHTLRHIFATRCLEKKVPVHIVAGWLGHLDGGALLLETYAHLVNSAAEAEALALDAPAKTEPSRSPFPVISALPPASRPSAMPVGLPNAA